MLKIGTQYEPTVDHKDGARDLLLLLQAQAIMIDTAVVHPMAKAYWKAASKPLGAATKRERVKKLKYEERARDSQHLFLPYVIETTGAWNIG